MITVVADEIGRVSVTHTPDHSNHGGRNKMKMVTCVVRPEKLESITDILDKLHIVGMTVTDVRGFGRQKGQVEHYRGGEYTIRFINKVRIDIVVQEEDVRKVIRTIIFFKNLSVIPTFRGIKGFMNTLTLKKFVKNIYGLG